MYELIKSSLQTYAFAAVFSGLWILLVVYGMFKKQKNRKQKDKNSFTIRHKWCTCLFVGMAFCLYKSIPDFFGLL